MAAMTAMLGLALILTVLFEACETMLLPRRVSPIVPAHADVLPEFLAALDGDGRVDPAGPPAVGVPQLLRPPLAAGAPQLLGPVVDRGLRPAPVVARHAPQGAGDDRPGLDLYAYFSGVTFFTLGYGDVTPVGAIGRALAVLETGIGFGFLAVVISYLPVLYQAFSRREVTITLLDARAGSPPTAGTLLARNARYGDQELLDQLLEEWERWAAEVLESHISFPVLSFYRSQHDNQSWLAALTAILDTSALVVAGHVGDRAYPGLPDLRHGPARGRGPLPGGLRVRRSSRPRIGSRRPACWPCASRSAAPAWS